MTAEQFKTRMKQAQAMLQFSNDRMEQEYLTGYLRGLRRHYHGEKFGTLDEHYKYLGLDGHRQSMGDGYRAGFTGEPIPTLTTNE